MAISIFSSWHARPNHYPGYIVNVACFTWLNRQQCTSAIYLVIFNKLAQLPKPTSNSLVSRTPTASGIIIISFTLIYDNLHVFCHKHKEKERSAILYTILWIERRKEEKNRNFVFNMPTSTLVWLVSMDRRKETTASTPFSVWIIGSKMYLDISR